MKKIFHNGNSLRAGWRITIFLFIYLIFAIIGNIALRYIPLPNILPTLRDQIFFYGLFFITTIVVIKFVDKRSIASVGLGMDKKTPLEIGKGIFISGGMMSSIVVIEYICSMYSFSLKDNFISSYSYNIGMSIAIFSIGAFGEELVFRGYIFQTLVEGTNKIIGIIIIAGGFALMHGNNPNITLLALINIFLAGVWLSLAYFRTQSLWFPTALHFSWNFFQNHIFSFPVSGLNFSQYQLGIITQSGPDWFTGGKFGPEGGALATIVLIGAIIITNNNWEKNKNLSFPHVCSGNP